MENKRFKYTQWVEWIMNKRGELFILAAFGIILLTAVGVYFVYDTSNTLYVGDKVEHTYMDYFKCSDIAKNISETNFIAFKSRDEAIKGNYTAVEGCT